MSSRCSACGDQVAARRWKRFAAGTTYCSSFPGPRGAGAVAPRHLHGRRPESRDHARRPLGLCRPGQAKILSVGTEGLFSRASHEIIKDEVAALGASVVGEEYFAVGDSSFAPVAAKVKPSGADVVLNSVSGAGNVALFDALRKRRPQTWRCAGYFLRPIRRGTAYARRAGDELAGNYGRLELFPKPVFGRPISSSSSDSAAVSARRGSSTIRWPRPIPGCTCGPRG